MSTFQYNSSTIEKKKSKEVTINKISPLRAYLLIKNSEGKIFSATFIKKDGTVRQMTCRVGVSKYVTGKGSNWNPEDKMMVGVFDVQKEAYRIINLETLCTLKINGQVYKVS